MKQSIQIMVISALTTAVMGGVILTVATAFAAPMQAPPGGNPTFPLQGLSGVPGAAGPTGPQGPSGTTTCRSRVNSCLSPAFGGCSVGQSATSGWRMTGGTCEAQFTTSYGLMAWMVGASDNSISCSCHDHSYATTGNCYAIVWECQ